MAIKNNLFQIIWIYLKKHILYYLPLTTNIYTRRYLYILGEVEKLTII